MESLSYAKYKVKQVPLVKKIKDANGYNCSLHGFLEYSILIGQSLLVMGAFETLLHETSKYL